jgi:transcriptional regulator of aromatic amino acid metabolism
MRLPAVRLTIRQKLVLLSVLILIVVSFGLALLQRGITRRVVEDDLRNVVTETMPPLCERTSDVGVLARHVLDKYARAAAKPVTGFARETLERLAERGAPGGGGAES